MRRTRSFRVFFVIAGQVRSTFTRSGILYNYKFYLYNIQIVSCKPPFLLRFGMIWEEKEGKGR